MINTSHSIPSAIPSDVIESIFYNLSLSELGISSRVCTVWREIARKQINTFCHENAFGPKEWFIHFGAHLRNVPRLPSNIAEILNSSCPIWPSKKVHETHLLTLIPDTINNQPFTLKTLGKLIQQPKTGPATQFEYLDLGEYHDNPVTRSYWVLMSRDVLEGSRNKSYQTQFDQVDSLAQKTDVPYAAPKVLEAATCILMHHISTGQKLYTDSPWMYTRCQEFHTQKKDWKLLVGGFGAGGLAVSDASGWGVSDFVGVSVCRKF